MHAQASKSTKDIVNFHFQNPNTPSLELWGHEPSLFYTTACLPRFEKLSGEVAGGGALKFLEKHASASHCFLETSFCSGFPEC